MSSCPKKEVGPNGSSGNCSARLLPETQERINGGVRSPSNERNGLYLLQLPTFVPSNRAAVLFREASSFVALRGLRLNSFGKLVFEHPAGHPEGHRLCSGTPVPVGLESLNG